MYTVSAMQDSAGHFATLDTAETFEAAIDSARCEVNGQRNGYSVYVFCDQMFAGKTYPYLVAKVTYVTGQHIPSGDIIVAYA